MIAHISRPKKLTLTISLLLVLMYTRTLVQFSQFKYILLETYWKYYTDKRWKCEIWVWHHGLEFSNHSVHMNTHKVRKMINVLIKPITLSIENYFSITKILMSSIRNDTQYFLLNWFAICCAIYFCSITPKEET